MEPNISSLDIETINAKLSAPLLILDAILGFYFIVGIIGNSVVAYIYSKKLRVKLDDKFFILVLAIVDIIVCLTAPPFSLLRNLYPVDTKSSNEVCKIAWFVTRTMNAISGFLILVIGIQRYLKVCRPFGKQMTGKLKIAALLATIFSTLVIHFPLFLYFGHNEIQFAPNITGYRCGLVQGRDKVADKGGVIFLYLVFLGAIFVMVLICIFYSLTARKIYKHIMKLENFPSGIDTSTADSLASTGSGVELDDPSGRKSSRHSHINKGSIMERFRKKSQGAISVRSKKSPFAIHRYSIMFSVISLLCVITYTPALAANLAVNVDSVEFWTEFTDGQRIGYLFLFQFYILNHVVNPFIYACFDSKFRKKLTAMCFCDRRR